MFARSFSVIVPFVALSLLASQAIAAVYDGKYCEFSTPAACITIPSPTCTLPGDQCTSTTSSPGRCTDSWFSSTCTTTPTACPGTCTRSFITCTASPSPFACL